MTLSQSSAAVINDLIVMDSDAGLNCVVLHPFSALNYTPFRCFQRDKNDCSETKKRLLGAIFSGKHLESLLDNGLYFTNT